MLQQASVLQLSIPHAASTVAVESLQRADKSGGRSSRRLFIAFDQKRNQHRISKCDVNGISKCAGNPALSNAVFITKSVH
jgi:hypothetical protein